MRRMAALVVFFGTGLSAAACALPDDWRAMDGTSETVRVAIAPVGEPVPVSQPFAIDIVTCGATVDGLDVAAIMPAHQHGMNYSPEISAADTAGEFRADGLLFHMPGAWQIQVTARTGSGPQRFILDVEAR